MKLAAFWTWQNWSLLLLNIVAESAFLIISLRKNIYRHFVSLPIYAAFSLAADLITVCMAFTVRVKAANGVYYYSPEYVRFWWAVQFIGGIFVLVLVLQIVTIVLPPWTRLIALIGVIATLSVSTVYLGFIHDADHRGWLTALSLADVVSVLALAIIWVVDQTKWPRGLPQIVTGLVASVALQFIFSTGALLAHTMKYFITVGPPIAALTGMAMFIAALRSLESPTSQGVEIPG